MEYQQPDSPGPWSEFSLTKGHWEVAMRLALRKRMKVISKELDISLRDANTCSARIYEKFNVRGRSQFIEAWNKQPGVTPGIIIGNLTSREIEIWEMAGKGMRRPEITEHLGISDATVGKHLSNIYEKTDLHSLPALKEAWNDALLDKTQRQEHATVGTEGAEPYTGP